MTVIFILEVQKMGKRLDCKDLQIDCGYSACSLTAEETIQKVGEHIQAGHAREGFSKEFYRKAIGALREQRCEQEISLDEFLCEACSGVCLC
jgi:predicted small metal-binding protein